MHVISFGQRSIMRRGYSSALNPVNGLATTFACMNVDAVWKTYIFACFLAYSFKRT